jgi:hypothetical protein
MLEHNQKDFPWTFYFNGMPMPKWGAQWPSFREERHGNWDADVGPRDFYIIRCKIDHVGKVESASPHVFLYAVQELLCLLVTEREGVLELIRHNIQCSEVYSGVNPLEVYHGLMEAAFEMRALTQRDGVAFWTSGYQSDQMQLMEAMRRAALPPSNPEFVAAPHVKNRQADLQRLWKQQVKILHAAASAGGVPKELRKRLLEL